MSPIGRVFIVINLLASGVFVYSAGTFLAQATNWKQKHDDVVTEKQEAEERMSAQLAESERKLQEAQLSLSGRDSSLRSTETQLGESRSENERLSAQLSSMEAAMKSSQSNLSTLSDRVSTAFDQAKQAYETALTADKEKNEALNKAVAAADDLRRAELKIADLESQIADRASQIAALSDERGQLQTMLNMFKEQNPGAFAAAVPAMSGVVKTVGPRGTMVTVELSHKAGEPQPGHLLAIHDGRNYKGEFRVDSVDNNFLFGRMIRKVENASISAGDRADSNPGK